MKKIELKVGNEYLYQGHLVRIQRILDLKSILVEFKTSGVLDKIPIINLQPIEDDSKIPDNNSNDILGKDDILKISDTDWEKAQKKFEIIKPILENRGELALVDDIAKQNNVSRATIYRWIAQYEVSDSVVSLVENKEGKGGKGKSRISPNVDVILRKAIEDFYLTSQRKIATKVIIEVKKQCKNNGLKSPGDNTIRRRIQQISEEEKVRHRFGKKVANSQFKPLEGSFPGANFPLSVVQIDHTLVDVQLVDETYRKTIGRPWLTLAIDVYSRMVVGFYLSFDPPGSIGTGLCIAHSILPKELWLSKLNIQSEWFCWGVMKTIHLDNAREFKSITLKRACEKYGINIDWRPVAQPNYGGHIERLMGTFMQEVHTLPGTTFSNIKERAKYPSEKKAALTLGEFEKWLTTFIIDVYHKRIHSALGRRPIDVYQEGIFGSPNQPGTGLPERIHNEAQVRLDFMPIEERTVQDYGIMIDHIHYYDDVLRKFINSVDLASGKARVKRKFTFRRDPRDISCVYFLDPDTKQYHRIPYRNTSHPSISVWEYRDAMKRLKDAGRENIDENAIFDAYDKMRKLELDAVEKTQKINKTRNRIIESSKTTTIFYQNGEKITNVLNQNIGIIENGQTNSDSFEATKITPNKIIKPFEGLDDE